MQQPVSCDGVFAPPHGGDPNAGPYVEFAIEGLDYDPGQDGLYGPALVAHDSHVQFPDGPGWGVEMNPGWLDKAAYRISELE